MTQEISKKMLLIASKAGDLNVADKVKAFTGHQKGYAKLVVINSGCKVWAQHTRADKLTIDLLITESAAQKWPDIRDVAVSTFKAFAMGNGYKLAEVPWQHSASETDTRQQHSFEITTESSEAIGLLIDKLKLAFLNLKSTSPR